MTARTTFATLGLAAMCFSTAGMAQTVTEPDAATAQPVAGAAAEPSAGGAATPAMPASDSLPVVPDDAAGADAVTTTGPDLVPVTFENGRWYNADGIPTFKIEDGVVDYATFSGFRRYHSECHVCHGPDGEGSSYAPALKTSVMGKLDYYEFQQIVASGQQNVGVASNLVMPAFGTNRNVWCYLDDIYTYLLARGADAIPRGRPAKKADKSEEFAELEKSCMEN